MKDIFLLGQDIIPHKQFAQVDPNESSIKAIADTDMMILKNTCPPFWNQYFEFFSFDYAF